MSQYMKTIEKKSMSPLDELRDLSKYVAEEGIVLLENKKNVLPIINKHVAVFGRIQFNYYKSGTGSGGLVNVRNVPNFIDTLRQSPNIFVDNTVYELYKEWVMDHPFDAGNGQWASEPWHQKEMELDLSHIKDAAKMNDIGIVIIGRTAGEDKDNYRGEGSYYLTQTEDELIKNVSEHFKKTIVILNVGNAVDLSFMDKYSIDGLIFAWHGGGMGAQALTDIIAGFKSPSGKLPMTLIKDLKDDPSDKNFGHRGEVIYEEDIYVGYRYFETFHKDAVRYPFGYGLTYTKFLIEPKTFDVVDTQIKFSVYVKNIGLELSKEVVQIYLEAPQGLLGKPKRVLAAYEKTKGLAPNEETTLEFEIDLFNLASYDDFGHIYKSSYVLEKGQYNFYIGNSVRHTKKFGKIILKDDLITLKSEELNAPNQPFKRIKPDQSFNVSYEDVPLRTVNYNERIKKETKKPLQTNDLNINLLDVYQKKYSMDQFIGSLSVDELIELTRGEGMSSPKVTAGTAAAFGGVSSKLLKKGVPIACAADGPSGIRMDSGFYASSLPIGILLASTFNLKLVEHLYELLGQEMLAYNVDVILGPGMNIIRHPLNGRNFEYFSEDPLVTGMTAASLVHGLQNAGVTGTLKHLFANNQETDRFNVNAVVSERAQREIYLKGFEIAIRSAKAKAIMTSYNPVNGLWTASNYDINKKLVHDEWGFKGIIVTDWWAKMNDWEGPGDVKNTKAMIISQNDLYMVITDAESNSNNDNAKASYLEGSLSLSHLQLTAKNILKFLLTTPAFHRMHQLTFKKEVLRYQPFFRTNQTSLHIPYLKQFEINGEQIKVKPYLQQIELQDIESIESMKAKADSIELHPDFKHAVIKKIEKGETYLLHVLVGEKLDHSNDLVDLNSIDFKMALPVGESAWNPIILKLNESVQLSEGIDVNSDRIQVNQQNSTISYVLEFVNSGKYLLDFMVSSEQSPLAQLPFSIYLNNVYQTTLTINGSEGHKKSSRASILVEPGKHVLTLKFNRSSINIHEFKVMRHG